VFDLFAYFFILLSILIVGHLAQNNQISAASFFTKLFSLWAVTYSALYGLSFVTTSIFGMPLRYYHFFSPLVDNVHQAASITCVMGFIMFFLALRAKSVLARLLYLVSAVLFAKMALDSGSTKAFLGVLFGVVVSVVFLVVYRPSGRNRFVFNILALTGFVAAIFAFIIARGDLVANVAIRFFMESDGGGAREALYSVGLAHGMKSFLVGYGPGSHAPYGGGFSDAHNTTLTVFLQGGLVGVLALVALAARFARELTVSPVLIGAATAIGMYFRGGDILRRLPTWIMMIGVVYFAREIHLARKSRALGTGHEIHSDPRVPHGQNASRFDKGRPVNQFPQVVKNR
jgi:O-antigen ligase